LRDGVSELRGRCPFAYYAATLARRLGRADFAAAAMRAIADALAEMRAPQPAAAAAAASSSSAAAAAPKRGAF
jgi:hypothetical protein